MNGSAKDLSQSATSLR